MGPTIIPASRVGLTNRSCALEQRSLADGRRAVGKIHRIEKMNHCRIPSLGVQAGWVKLSDAFPANVARQLDDRNGFLRFDRREKALAFVATGEVKGSKRMCG